VALNVCVADRGGEAGVIVPDSFNLAHLIEGESDASCASGSLIRVKAFSLNTLIKKLGLQNLKNIMLRMDIEGYEYRILSENIPEQISLIDVELHSNNYDVKEFCQKILVQGFLIEYLIGDIPFGLYPLINTFVLRLLKF
jgi:hypothetical protein